MILKIKEFKKEKCSASEPPTLSNQIIRVVMRRGKYMACQCVSLGYGAEESATAVRSGLFEAVTLGTRLVATTDLRALTPAAP